MSELVQGHRPWLRRTAAAALLAVAGLVLTGAPVTAYEKPTGQTCNYDFGTRCAKGSVVYYSYSSTLWRITYYKMYYYVASGLTYGPHHNEDPFTIYTGYSSGTRTYYSPDDGVANTWISRTGFGTSYTRKGQTTVKIVAVPDVPAWPDPHLNIYTAKW